MSSHWLAIGGEFLNTREQVPQKVQRRFASMAAAKFLDAFHAEFLVLDVSGVAETIRKKRTESPGSSRTVSSS